jgi:hypothetical protein
MGRGGDLDGAFERGHGTSLCRDREGTQAARRVRWAGRPLPALGVEGVAQPSSSRLKASTTTKLDRPGKALIHGAWLRKRCAEFTLPTARREPGCHDRADRDARAGASRMKATAARGRGLRSADLLRRVYDIDTRSCPNFGLGTLEPIGSNLGPRHHRPWPARKQNANRSDASSALDFTP